MKGFESCFHFTQGFNFANEESIVAALQARVWALEAPWHNDSPEPPAFRPPLIRITGPANSGKSFLAGKIIHPLHRRKIRNSLTDMSETIKEVVNAQCTYLILDKIRTPLISDALSAFITAPSWQDSQHQPVRLRTLTIVTTRVNDISTDLLARSLHIRLLPRDPAA